MTKVKIVCTIGPACSNYDTLRSMALAGMNVASSTSAMGVRGARTDAELVRSVEKDLNSPIPTLLDTKGPEIRTGKLEGGAAALESGGVLTLTDEKIVGDGSRVFVNYPRLADEVTVGQEIFIDDGALHLEVDSISGREVVCRVIVGGLLGDSKGVNIPGAELSLPALSDKDLEDIRWGVDREMDFIAVSFVKNSRDIMEVRRAMESFGGV